MSRSVKKNPIAGITMSESEKHDKKEWHKRLRQKTRQMLSQTRYDGDELESVVLPDVHDVSDTWAMSKDGKTYFGEDKLRRGAGYQRMGDNRYVSMAAEWFKKLMRK